MVGGIQCTEAEEQRVRSWLDEDQNHRAHLEELALIWSATGEFPPDETSSDWRTDTEWDSLWNRIEQSANRSKKSATIHLESEFNSPTSWIGERTAQLLRIAAILLVVSTAGVVAWLNQPATPSSSDQLTYRELIIERGQRSNMVLSDGSGISINSDTRFRIPEHFASDRREIILESGEIFVDIVSDPDRPFLIHIDDAIVEVLGTSFSVRSYPEDDEVKVVVREGTVALSSRNEPSGKVTLIAHQIGRLNLQHGYLSSELVEDLDLHLSWTDGYLKFRDAPLDVVVRQLERRFNIDIRLEDDDLADLLLTAELRGRTTYNVLNVIATALGIHYRQPAEDLIIFSREP